MLAFDFCQVLRKARSYLPATAAQPGRLVLHIGFSDHLLVSDRGRGKVALFG
jgi:hypothetical protein